MPIHRHPARAVVAALGLVTVLASCSSSDDSGARKSDAQTVLVGWATAGGPLEGASVKILDRAGKEIGHAKETTSPNGTWAADVAHLPIDFAVVVKGGDDGRRAFDGVLRSEVRDYTGWTTVHVNLATTMVSRELAEHPDTSLAAATSAVRSTLGLSEANDLAVHLRVSERDFSGRAFMEEARTKRGTTALLDDLATDVHARRAHPFVAPPSNDLVGESVLSTFLGQVGRGMASQLGQTVFSQALNTIGLGQATASQVAALSTQIDALSAQVSQLQQSITDLASALDEDAYTQEEPPTSISTVITQANDNYTFALAAVPGAHATQAINNFKSYVNENNAELMDGLGTISTALLGVAGGQGALAAWKTVVNDGTPRFVTADLQARLDTSFQYWAGLQLMLYNVGLEYESLVNGYAWPELCPANPGATTTTARHGTTTSIRGATTVPFAKYKQFLQGTDRCDYFTWDAGPLGQEHAAAGTMGLDLLPTQADGHFDAILDRATGLVWLRTRVSTLLGAPAGSDPSNSDATKCIYQGNPNCQLSDADTALATMNADTTLAHGFTFRYPTGDEVVGLVAEYPAAGFTGWAKNSPASPAAFLEQVGACTPSGMTTPTCTFAPDLTSADPRWGTVWSTQPDQTSLNTAAEANSDQATADWAGGTYRSLLNISTSQANYQCSNDRCSEFVNRGDRSFPTLQNIGAILLPVAIRPTGARYWYDDPGQPVG